MAQQRARVLTRDSFSNLLLLIPTCGSDHGRDEGAATRKFIFAKFQAHRLRDMSLRRSGLGKLELEIENQTCDRLKMSLICREEAAAEPVALHPQRRACGDAKIYAATAHSCQSRVISKQPCRLAKTEKFHSDEGVCPGFDPAMAAKREVRAAPRKQRFDSQTRGDCSCARIPETPTHLIPSRLIRLN